MAEDTEVDEKPLAVTTEVKDGEKWARTVNVTVAVEDVNEIYRGVLSGIMGMVTLPGFRAGKVPRDVVEKRFGGEIKKEVLTKLVQRGVPAAIESANLDVCGQPELANPDALVVEKGKPFTFALNLEVAPTFELPEYKGLKVEQQEIDVLPVEIDNAIASLTQRFASEGPAPEGHGVTDRNVADGVLRTLVEGVEVDKEEDSKLVVTHGHVYGVPAHVAADFLLGAKVGEKRTVEETLQNTFKVEAHRGKRATFEFEVKGITVEKLPGLDEVAKGMQLEDEAALREKIRSSLLEQIGNRIKADTSQALLKQIIDKAPFELPEKALAMASSERLQESAHHLQQQGMMEMLNQETVPQLIEMTKKRAEYDLKRAFILRAVAKKEDINVEDEEIDDVVMQIARERKTSGPALLEKMAETGEAEQIEESLRLKKAEDLIVDSAEIAVVPRKPFVEHDEEGHGHEHSHAHAAEAGQEHSHEIEHAAEVGHEHAAETGHEHGHEHAAPAAEHGHEHGHDCGHEHGHEHGHDCGHEHGTKA